MNKPFLRLVVGVAALGTSQLGALQPPAGEAVPAATQPQPKSLYKGEDLRAAGDQAKRYFLFDLKPDAAATRAGFKLLLILPGGDGSAEFNSFAASIYQNALPSDYVVAQLVAPQWTPKQAKVLVWPRNGHTIPEARFTTEQFMADVIKEVKERHPIDEKSIYALGWSSSGPPVYAATMMEDSPLAGAFIAMSIFPTNTLPPLKQAAGKAFYLLHSPEDGIAISEAETALDQLNSAGAQATLATYRGGHGWHGDVHGMIRTGMQWLESAESKGSKDQNPKTEKSTGSKDQNPK